MPLPHPKQGRACHKALTYDDNTANRRGNNQTQRSITGGVYLHYVFTIKSEAHDKTILTHTLISSEINSYCFISDGHGCLGILVSVTVVSKTPANSVWMRSSRTGQWQRVLAYDGHNTL